MATLREWLDRLLGTLRLRRGDADLEAELRVSITDVMPLGAPLVVLAALPPALRAVRIDPTRTLRAE